MPRLDVAAEAILKAANEPIEGYPKDQPYKTVKEVFSANEAEKILGTLVLPGEKPDTFRLPAIQQAEIRIHIKSPGMSAFMNYPEMNTSVGEMRRFTAIGEQEITVFPGEYSVWKEDRQVGWSAWSASRLSGAKTILVNAGDSEEFLVERDWNDYLTPVPYLGQEDTFTFRWFPPEFFSGGVMVGVYNVNRTQADVISRLLGHLARGKPDVPERELIADLQRDGELVKSLDQLFGGLEHWKDLIVPGKEPETWRLKPPTPEQIGEEEYTRIYGPEM